MGPEENEWVADEVDDEEVSTPRDVGAEAWLPKSVDSEGAESATVHAADRPEGPTPEPRPAPDTTEWLAVPAASHGSAGAETPSTPPATPHETKEHVATSDDAPRRGLFRRRRRSEGPSTVEAGTGGSEQAELPLPAWAMPAETAGATTETESVDQTPDAPTQPPETDGPQPAREIRSRQSAPESAPEARLEEMQRAHQLERGALEARVSAAESAAREAQQAHEQVVRAHQAEHRELSSKVALSEQARRSAEERHAVEMLEIREELDAKLEALERTERTHAATASGLTERLTAAETAQTEAETRHRSEVERVQTELVAARAQLRERDERYQAEVRELRDELHTSTEALARSEREHAASTSGLTERLAAAEAAQGEAETRHRSEVERVQTELVAAREQLEALQRSEEEHAASTSALTVRLGAAEDARAHADAQRHSETERLEAELTAAKEALRDATERHAVEAGELRDALEARSKALQGAEQEHRSRVAELADELSAARAGAARADDLQEELAAIRTRADEATQSHLGEIERLAAKHRESEHARTEAEAAQNDLENAHEEAIARHSAEASDLHERLAEAERARGEALGARDQAAAHHAAELEQLQTRLAAAESALAEQRSQTERVLEQASNDAQAYDARIADIQRQLDKYERAARQATERMVAATSGARQDDSGRYELNTITVEGLRQLGLSVTQAARLVRHREARGGFHDVGEIEDVPGLSADHRTDLMNRVYVDTGMVGRPTT
jgi:DNA uptake protein ComE-like DNA-binding protein